MSENIYKTMAQDYTALGFKAGIEIHLTQLVSLGWHAILKVDTNCVWSTELD